jgi:hypothetical protein
MDPFAERRTLETRIQKLTEKPGTVHIGKLRHAESELGRVGDRAATVRAKMEEPPMVSTP